MKKKRLIVRENKFDYSIGYYDKCNCGYACNKHFRVLEIVSKYKVTFSGAETLAKEWAYKHESLYEV